MYASVHHGNTKKIVDEIAKDQNVDLVDATQVKEKDLTEYDAIGFASGNQFMDVLAGLGICEGYSPY